MNLIGLDISYLKKSNYMTSQEQFEFVMSIYPEMDVSEYNRRLNIFQFLKSSEVEESIRNNKPLFPKD